MNDYALEAFIAGAVLGVLLAIMVNAWVRRLSVPKCSCGETDCTRTASGDYCCHACWEAS